MKKQINITLPLKYIEILETICKRTLMSPSAIVAQLISGNSALIEGLLGSSLKLLAAPALTPTAPKTEDLED
jgi:hypothetical protein